MDTQVVSGIQGFMSNGGMLIILMIALFAVMIIPQRKREKKIKDMLANLKPGDRVRTIGGLAPLAPTRYVGYSFAAP